MKSKALFLILLILPLLNISCYRMRASKGGGQDASVTRNTNPKDIAMAPGYKIELVSQGFTFPTDIVFDEDGKMYVLEAGYAYGEVWQEPKLVAVSGTTTNIIARGDKNGPWTGVTFHNGNFYVSE